MKKAITVNTFALLLLLLIGPGVTPAFADYGGEWNRVSFSFAVSVESWGDNCGSRPKSYYNKKIKPTQIIQTGSHLIFSNGGLRTDQCISPNPRLTSISTSITANRWHRICETAKTDPKYERVEYTLTGNGSDTLTYVAKSRFDWSLKDDHCVVSWSEKRVFKRTSSSPETSPSKGDSSPIIDTHSKPQGESNGTSTKCNVRSTPHKLTLHPQHPTLKPGEKACFKTTATDSKGCSYTAQVTWSVVKDGHPANELISKQGCFTAGKTAAETEGTYQIVGLYNGKHAQTTLTVLFPETGDLAQAELDLSGELVPNGSQNQAASPIPPENASPQETLTIPVNQTKSGTKSNKGLIIIVLLVGGTVVIALLLIALYLNKKGIARKPSDSIWNDFEPSEDPPISPVGHICPKCNTKFPQDAQFCPHDGAALIPEDAQSPGPNGSQGLKYPNNPKGMICPRCHRGYDRNSKFCPHDSTKLMRYSEWRALQNKKS